MSLSLRLEIKRLFSKRTRKVYSVDLHPTEVLWSLESGHVCTLSCQSLPKIKDVTNSFEISKLPVQSAKFVNGKQWIVAAVDCVFIHVLDCNSGTRLKSFAAHDDQINCILVHPTLPFVLTSSNDKLIKIWKWDERWKCAKSLDAHLDDVVDLSLGEKSISFASASRDHTVKIWSLDSPGPKSSHHVEDINSVGLSDDGCLVTGSTTSKVWDYKKKSCIAELEQQHGIITVVGFHPELPIIITGSKDGKLRIWNAKSFRLEKTLNYCLGGVSAVGYKKGLKMLVVGDEEGVVLLEINREISFPSMDDNGSIIWLKDKIQNVKFNLEYEVIEGSIFSLSEKDLGRCGKDLGRCEIYPQSFKHNSDGSYIGVCGDGTYMIYSARAWKIKASGRAMQLVWSSQREYAIIENTSRVKIFNKSFQYAVMQMLNALHSHIQGSEVNDKINSVASLEAIFAWFLDYNKLFKEKKVICPTVPVKQICGGHLLSLCSAETICFYDWADGRMIQEFEMNTRDVYWADSVCLVAVASNVSLFIFKFNQEAGTFEMLSKITELVRSGSWVGDKFIYVNYAWRLNCYSEGKVTSMYCPKHYLDRPMHMLGYLPNQRRLHLFDKDMNIVGYPFSQAFIDYQLLVMQGDLEAAHSILSSIPKAQHNSVAHFLESRGFLEEAHEITTDAEHKFRLAAKLGNLEVGQVGNVHRFIGPSEIQTRMALEGDFEFSWKDDLFYGHNIVPAVRDQGNASTCVFQALCAGGEMEKLKTAASNDPSTTTDIKFLASRFVSEYEAKAGPIPHDTEHKRLPTALDLFMNRGVYAEGGGAPLKRYKIASSQDHSGKSFQEIAALIMDGRPVIGGFRVDNSFKKLKPEDIYDYNDEDSKLSDRGKRYTHAVVFIGFGRRAGRPYLVFLDSHGKDFCDEGFGRVYFEHARFFTTIEF